MNNQREKDVMASNIKKYMERKGVTNQQVCDALDIKYTTFVDWINAKTYPRIGKIQLLADYFGVRKSDLVEERVPPAYTGQGDDEEIRRRLHYYADYGEPDVRKKLVELLDLFESQK